MDFDIVPWLYGALLVFKLVLFALLVLMVVAGVRAAIRMLRK